MVGEVLVEGKGQISSKPDCPENGEKRTDPNKLEVVVGGLG